MRGLTVLLMLFLLSANLHAQPAAPEPILTLGRGEIVSAAWAPDGQSIWISTTAGTWQLDTALREIAAYPHITYAALSPDGTRLAGISLDGFIDIWDAGTGEPEFPNPHGFVAKHPISFLWSQDGRYVAFNSAFYTHFIEAGEYSGPNFSVPKGTLLAWSQTGKYIAGFNPDYHGVWVFDLSKEQLLDLPSRETRLVHSVNDLYWRGDDELFFFGDGGSTAFRWLVPQVEVLPAQPIQCRSYYGCAFNASHSLVLGGGDFGLNVQDVATGERIYATHQEYFGTAAWAAKNNFAITELDVWGRGLAVSNQDALGRQIWQQPSIGFRTENLHWDATGAQLLAIGQGRLALLDGLTGEILSRNEDFRAFQFGTPDTRGERIALADTFDEVHIVRIDSINATGVVTETAASMFRIAEVEWQPNGDSLTIRDKSLNGDTGNVRLWSDSNTLPFSVSDNTSVASDIAWSNDGSSLAVLSKGAVKFYGDRQDVITDLLRDTSMMLHSYHFVEVQWTQAGEPVVSYVICCHMDPIVKAIDSGLNSYAPTHEWTLAEDGHIVSAARPILGHDARPYVTHATFDGRTSIVLEGAFAERSPQISPLGTQVAAIDASGSGLIWDATTGQPLDFLANVHELVWTPDDSTLAILRRDGSLWLQNAGGLRLLWSPTVPVRAPGTLVWCADGSTLAHVQDGVLRVWQP